MVSINRPNMATNASRVKDGIVVITICYGLAVLFGWKAPVSLNEKSYFDVTGDSYNDAFEESFGFFDDITNEQWARKKKWLKELPQSQETNGTFVGMDIILRAYTNNWNPDFSCPFNSLVGPVGDGHKWICDPHRLQKVEDCLVYSIGSNGKFGFEADLLRLAPNCEIHIFDPDDYTAAMNYNNVDAHYHAWGLTSTAQFKASLKGKKDRDAIKFKDIKEIMRLLKHEKRTIHVFKIDCENCEWETYMDWLPLDIRQFQVETHRWRANSLNFFEEARKAGYAMFSKEANIIVMGQAIEFSFIKLKKSFFE